MKTNWKRIWLWAVTLLVAIGLISIPFWGLHHTQKSQSSNGGSKQTQTTQPKNPTSPNKPPSGNQTTSSGSGSKGATTSKGGSTPTKQKGSKQPTQSKNPSTGKSNSGSSKTTSKQPTKSKKPTQSNSGSGQTTSKNPSNGQPNSGSGKSTSKQPTKSKKPTQSNSGSTPTKNKNPKPSVNPNKLFWGVDTASKITPSFFQGVVRNYGKPMFVARYLTTKSGIYNGLTKSEITFLHKKGVKILPIYDHFTNATGYSQGTKIAQNAVNKAKQLGFPKGTVIAADIERSKPVNASFLEGWTKSIVNSGYKAAVYGNFETGGIKPAYNHAINQSSFTKNHLIIWTNEKSIGVSSKQNAPNHFNSISPNQSQTLIWQYGINGQKSNIDTDLLKGKLYNNLW